MKTNLDGTPCPSCASRYTVEVSPHRDVLCATCGKTWVQP